MFYAHHPDDFWQDEVRLLQKWDTGIVSRILLGWKKVKNILQFFSWMTQATVLLISWNTLARIKVLGGNFPSLPVFKYIYLLDYCKPIITVEYLVLLGQIIHITARKQLELKNTLFTLLFFAKKLLHWIKRICTRGGWYTLKRSYKQQKPPSRHSIQIKMKKKFNSSSMLLKWNFFFNSSSMFLVTWSILKVVHLWNFRSRPIKKTAAYV